jgi:small subunit ribosomal protein S16
LPFATINPLLTVTKKILLTLRLQRTGKTGQPNFRVVLQDHKSAVKGKALEILGHYQPALNPKVVKIDLERAKYWMSVGAKPSDTVAVLLKGQGMEGMEKYMEPRDKKRKKKGEQAEAPAVAAPAPKAAEPPKAEQTPPAEAPKAA